VNKAELIASIADKSGLSKKNAEAALNGFVDSVREALADDQKVQLVGFGSFEVRERKEREGRNPRDPKQKIKIPASKAPVFKAGKTLKAAVNK
jgi:DNA-binding protein HU-beta